MEKNELASGIAYIIFVIIMMFASYALYKFKTADNISNIESELYQHTYPYQED